mmetsp:Transcript_36996/g.92465  ORF Transcript_36996/g.92465 Transcript_36996/m.92465 type:complete len:382 (-) Transcript_36996:297-1442(-)
MCLESPLGRLDSRAAGFLIDPAATPARVALGIISVMVVLQNYIALSRALPPGVNNAWLGRFTLVSFMFNIVAFIEQVLVSFGIQANKWLEAQHNMIKGVETWEAALLQNRHALLDLFAEWDVNGDGLISKKEWRKGVEAIGLKAPITEVNALFDSYDTDGSGTIELTEMLGKMEATSRASQPTSQPTVAAVAAIAEVDEEDEDGVVRDSANEQDVKIAIPMARHVAPSNAARKKQCMASDVVALPPAASAPAAAAAATGASAPAAVAAAPAATVVSATRKFSRKMSLGAASVVSTEVAKTRELRTKMRLHTRDQLDKTRVWAFKTFWLFPCLVRLRHLDHVSRLLFPMAYIIFFMVHLSEVNFGSDNSALIKSHPCRGSYD